MSILFLVRSMGQGGAERQLLVLARSLRDRGHAVAVALFYREGAFLDELTASGVEVVHLDRQGLWSLPAALLRLYRAVRRLRPDVVHGYTVVPNLLTLLLRPILRHTTRIVWGVRASEIEDARYDAPTYFAFRASCRLAQFADRIIANSWSGAEYHRLQGYPADKLIVIPNGIDHVRFRPDPESGAQLRREWRLDGARSVIGLVGRIDPLKDHETFLRAAALVAAGDTDIRFLCVGDGPVAPLATLRRLAEELGLSERVLWIEAREDMPAVYNAFDLCCSTSISEGFSNVLGEAMACGVPCVATDVGDAARIVGPTGLVVPARDPQRLAEAMRSMLQRLTPDARHQARARIVDCFGIESLVSRSEEALSAPRRLPDE
ncbi:MAG: glycosyltransferase [Gemmatimonadota bacterium]